MNNISSSDKKAYAEIDYILHNMNPTYLHKVPTKLVKCIKFELLV